MEAMLPATSAGYDGCLTLGAQMLDKFRGIDANTEGDFVIRYADESGHEIKLQVQRAAVPLLVAAILAQADRTPAGQRTVVQPIRVTGVKGVSGADGSPGLAFQLTEGYLFPVIFPRELLPMVRMALADSERLLGSPTGKPS